MPLKVFPDDGTSYVSTVVEADVLRRAQRAHIMNLSLGAPYDTSFTDPIVEMYHNGGLTVCAAGNEVSQFTDARSTWSSPACNNGPNPLTDNMVLGVGGLNNLDQKASWSNDDASTRNNFVEAFAPGVNIHGCAVHYPSIPGSQAGSPTTAARLSRAPSWRVWPLPKAQNPSGPPPTSSRSSAATATMLTPRTPATRGSSARGG